MNDVNCNIIKDLLPLYVDDVLSEESRAFVEEHLSGCEQCSGILEVLKKHVSIPAETKTGMLKALKKKMFRKKLKIAAVTALCCAVIACILLFIFNHEIPIAYGGDLVNVNLAYDGVIDIKFQGDDYHRMHAVSCSVEKDGIGQNVVFIQYTDSIWTKYLTNLKKHEPYQFSIGNNIMVDFSKRGTAIPAMENISAVYYVNGDYNTFLLTPRDESFTDQNNCVLIWER